MATLESFLTRAASFTQNDTEPTRRAAFVEHGMRYINKNTGLREGVVARTYENGGLYFSFCRSTVLTAVICSNGLGDEFYGLIHRDSDLDCPFTLICADTGEALYLEGYLWSVEQA